MSLSLLCFYVYLSKDRDVNISDAGLAHLQGFTALQRLDLSGNGNISDAGLAHLQGLTALQTLDLSSNDTISDAGLAHLHGLADLRDLSLKFCSDTITQPVLAGLLDRCTRIKSIFLPPCCRYHGEFIGQLKDRGLKVIVS